MGAMHGADGHAPFTSDTSQSMEQDLWMHIQPFWIVTPFASHVAPLHVHNCAHSRSIVHTAPLYAEDSPAHFRMYIFAHAKIIYRHLCLVLPMM